MSKRLQKIVRYGHIAKMKLLRLASKKQRELQPAQGELKWATLREIKNLNGINVFVETGTYRGDTVNHFKNDFKKIYSVEVGSEFANSAKQRFAGYPNVEIVEGDSAQVLPSIINKLAEPALFWLDAHCSEGDTARGTDYSPIISELKIILSSPLNHAVMIDDARLFNGVNYPTLGAIRRQVSKMRPSCACTVKDDLIHIICHDKS